MFRNADTTHMSRYTVSMKKAFCILALAYLTALLCCVFLSSVLSFGLVENTVLLSVSATTIVFIFSLTTDNSSMYDPYWSVAPVCITLYWMKKANVPGILFFILLLVWSIRLTANCCIHWKGLSDEDWRYRSFRKATGKLYWPVSYLAIHMIPTFFVLGNMLPVLYILEGKVTNLFLVVTGYVMMLAAFLLELVADRQMDHYQKTRTDDTACCTEGLWAYSRHPNYLGENCLWWGIFIASLGCGGNPILIIAPIAMTALFLSYSIPAMEKRQCEHRPSYKEIQKRVPLFLITGKHW